MKEAVTGEAVKGAIAAIMAWLASFTASQLLTYLTIGYILVQLLYLVRKWYKEEVDFKGMKKRRNQRSTP